MTRSEAIREKRKELIELSKGVRPLVDEGEYDHINEAIVEAVYKEENPDIKELNTLKQWNKKGYRVNKGEKAKLVWGQPRKVEQVPEGSDEPEEYKLWPVCFLFANTQVSKVEKFKPETVS